MSYRERFKEEAVLDSSVFPLGELLISTARKEYTTTHSWFSQGWNYQMTLWKGVGLPCVGWMCMSRDEYHPSPDNVSGFFFTRRTTASGASSGRFQEWKPWSWELREWDKSKKWPNLGSSFVRTPTCLQKCQWPATIIPHEAASHGISNIRGLRFQRM